MRSFLKRKPEREVVTATPPWHPDFRLLDQLPDTKVIRTTFFINGIPAVLALACVLWFAYSEYQVRDIRRQVDQLQREINLNGPVSVKSVALYKNFQAEAARITEVDGFVRSRPLISELVMRFAETLPANVALDGLDLRDMTLIVRGAVRGAPDQASGYASAYVQKLKSDAQLGARFEGITLVNLSRNAATGRLSFEISMRLKGAGSGGKKS